MHKFFRYFYMGKNMQKNFRHIFGLFLALQVIAASTGAAFYRHYCSTGGELIAVSLYIETGEACCMNNHEGSPDESHTNHDDGCCDLQYEFRKAETAPIAESLKLAVPSLILVLPERFFSTPWPCSQVCEVTDRLSFTDNYFPLFYYAGKALLLIIQQFRL